MTMKGKDAKKSACNEELMRVNQFPNQLVNDTLHLAHIHTTSEQYDDELFRHGVCNSSEFFFMVKFSAAQHVHRCRCLIAIETKLKMKSIH